MSNKAYIGDGVYVEFDGYYYILTTEDGIRTTNTIYLEPRVTKDFLEYITRTEDKNGQAEREGAGS